jgi:DNA-binding PadR family transcriptional regulator
MSWFAGQFRSGDRNQNTKSNHNFTRRHRHDDDRPERGPDDRAHGRRFARGRHGDPLGPDMERDGRHGRHHGGGRHRLFDHGELRVILLSMIAARPSHGYDLIKALEDRMGGGYSPSPGVIYPTLTLLEEQGLASVTPDGGKKLYAATEEGKAFLAANQATIEAIQARIGALARERGIAPSPRIIRAIENLKTALRLRLAAGPIPEARIDAIAAAIDAAAAEAERA